MKIDNIKIESDINYNANIIKKKFSTFKDCYQIIYVFSPLDD